MTALQKLARHRTPAADPVAYLPLVERLAKRLAKRLPAHIELADLVGAGVLGLMEALQRFDPQRQVSFDSYAAFRIRGAMLDELRRRDLMARDARRETKQIQAVIESLHHRLGRSPEDHEVADAMGSDTQALMARLEKLAPVQILSLDDEEAAPGELSQPCAFEEVAKTQIKHNLVAALARLSERAQRVLHLYYQEDLTLRQIGEVLEISESRVSQIMSKATLELRVLLRQPQVQKRPS